MTPSLPPSNLLKTGVGPSVVQLPFLVTPVWGKKGK